MGSLIKSTYTIPVPEWAVIKGNDVMWTAKGEIKNGKLSKSGKVLCQSEIWIAKYVDEHGNTKRVTTKCKDRDMAQRVLFKFEDEVMRIRAGIMTRKEIDVASSKEASIQKVLDDFLIHKKAEGITLSQTKKYRGNLTRFFKEAKIESLGDIVQETLDCWIIDSKEIHNRGPRTINSYTDLLRTLCRWCVETRKLNSDPTANIKDQNELIDTRKQRRALTDGEVQKLLVVAATRKRRSVSKVSGNEIELIYRTMLGTGLRSTEMASLRVWQIDTEKQLINLKPMETKNKKGGWQPISKDLAERLAEWTKEKSSGDVVFHHNRDILYTSFKCDCKSAGMERHFEDGRSIDVHSLRRTFGTRLARAGVPLTTTQRLMRHSTPELTAKLYIDVEEIDLRDAIDRLG